LIIHDQGIDEPIAKTENLTPRTDYYIFDGLGSVTELTDSSQAVVESYKGIKGTFVLAQ
jgi:hypothetical protein